MPSSDGAERPHSKRASPSVQQEVQQRRDGNTVLQLPSDINSGSMESILSHLGPSLSMACASSVQKPKNLKPGFCQNRAHRANYMACGSARMAIDGGSGAWLSTRDPYKELWHLLQLLAPLTLPPQANALL